MSRNPAPKRPPAKQELPWNRDGEGPLYVSPTIYAALNKAKPLPGKPRPNGYIEVTHS